MSIVGVLINKTTVGSMQLKHFPLLNSGSKQSANKVLLAPWTHYNMRMTE